jgi:hypothetical protein
MQNALGKFNLKMTALRKTGCCSQGDAGIPHAGMPEAQRD